MLILISHRALIESTFPNSGKGGKGFNLSFGSDFIQLDGNVSFMSCENESNNENETNPIPVHISANRSSRSEPADRGKPVRVTVRRNNLMLQAINLPVVMNINPRSIYNKSEEFSLLLEQYDADVICMSESFERENLPLEQLLDLPEMK